MTQSPVSPLWRRGLSLFLLLAAMAALFGRPSLGQVPDRITSNLSTADAVALKGSLHPLARAEFDRGRVSGVTKVPHMTLVFTPSATQLADLKSLLAAQQNPGSSSYHQWLTPAQYAARFGMSNADIAAAEAWLQAQGFAIFDVSKGRDAIYFSGTVAQVEAAFRTEVHQYQVNGTMHLANSTALTLPAALATAVSGVRGIAQFPPHPMHSAVRRPSANAVKPQFYSTISQENYLVPDDITTIYDIKALYSAGYTGTNQTIAIVGQSAIATADIDAFRTASGLAIKEPVQVLVPNTGVSAVGSDEDEADIDLEWSGAIAPDATIYFVYTGNDSSSDVFDAMNYAIDNVTAPVISISYGECEFYAGSLAQTFEPIFMKANAQGQTILASAGDTGATGCDSGVTGTTVAPATEGLQISYPASSAYVTAMGGTEFNEGSGSYWNTTNNADMGSALSYIPEMAWNDTATSNAQSPPGGFASTGGGASTLFGKPSWQVAAGVPNDGARDNPDISLDAANFHDAFLFCTAGSCTNGFRDASNDLTAAGGTSFDAPVFAGILTLINQKNSSAGAGNINPELYSLSASAPTAFHDVTVGNNEQPCASGSIDCASGTTEIGYAAAAGYDLATGLGSIDAYNLANVFAATNPVGPGALIVTGTTLTAATSTPITGTAVTFTASVTSASGTATPSSGTVAFTVDGGTAVAAMLTNGIATYAATFSTVGAHSVSAAYAGDATYAASTASLAVTVASSTTTGSFTMAATNVSVAASGSADSTLTVTGTNGYSGIVGLSYTAPTNFTGCLFASDIGVGTNGVVNSVVTVDTVNADCVSSGTRRMLARSKPVVAANETPSPVKPGREYPIAAAAVLAGLALLGRKRKAWPVAMVLLLAGLGTLSGCGGGSSSNPITLPQSGTTYTITLTGTDDVHTALTATTTFTVTVQ